MVTEYFPQNTSRCPNVFFFAGLLLFQCRSPTLTLVLLNCLFLFSIHSKLELLTQYTALNDEKITFYEKNLQK